MDAEFDGIATGLSTAITKDGQTATSARIPFAAGASSFAGAVGGVSYSFSNDPNTGFYSPAADQVALVAGGVATLTSTATTVTVPVDAAVTGSLTVTGALSFLPAGIVVPYAGSAAPTGWLICDGSSLVRTDYGALFTAIGTTYGSADGTHFTLPDLTGRVIAGKEASATRITSAGSGIDGATLGASGGAQNKVLLQANLPAVNFTVSGTHIHGTGGFYKANGFTGGSVSGSAIQNILTTDGNTWSTDASASGAGLTVASGGSGTAAVIMQPTIVLNYIIKT